LWADSLKLIADCSKLLTSLGIEYVGFRFGDVAPEQRDVFYPDGPHCVRLKLTAAFEIPAPSDPKIKNAKSRKPGPRYTQKPARASARGGCPYVIPLAPSCGKGLLSFE